MTWRPGGASKSTRCAVTSSRLGRVHGVATPLNDYIYDTLKLEDLQAARRAQGGNTVTALRQHTEKIAVDRGMQVSAVVAEPPKVQRR